MSTAEFYTQISKEQSVLRSFAQKLTMNQEDAKDLLQDTLIKAIKYKDSFSPASNLKAWLCVIMKNTFINQYRRQNIKNELIKKSAINIKENIRANLHTNTSDSFVYNKDIQKVIDELKDELKIPFLRFVEGFKYKEISEELNLPIGTVKSRIFLARKEMVQKLKHDYANYLN
ncbi:MAG: sigma-70 family RNA polymerase sigma factor [Cytophagaceae bacterium]